MKHNHWCKLATEPEGQFSNTNNSPEGHLHFKCTVWRCSLPLSQSVMPEIYGLLKDSRFWEYTRFINTKLMSLSRLQSGNPAANPAIQWPIRWVSKPSQWSEVWVWAVSLSRYLSQNPSWIQLRLTAVSLDLEPAQNLAQTHGFSTLLIPNRDPESIYSLDCTGSLL